MRKCENAESKPHLSVLPLILLKTKNWKYYSKIVFKYMIVSWDPFLMKILLKKEVCTSREQCTGPTGKVGKKKKKRQM